MTDGPLLPQLAEWADAVSWETLPDAVRAAAAARVVDIVGLCLGARDLDTSRAAIEHVVESGGSPQATAIGTSVRVPAAAAAFVNGVLAHSLDYDDTHLPSILHPSASVVPAALAAAELTGADGHRTLAAIAVGIEVCVRVGMGGYDRATRQSLFFEHGQHATSICGTLGAAAATAHLLGLGGSGITDAVAIAASMGSGVIEANRTGGTVKRLHCGWAAQAGVTAALLTKRGFTGPPTVLEGRFGFFQAWINGNYDAAAVVGGLGERWAVAELHDKPYPANHFTHAIADAAISLRAAGVTAAELELATLGVAAPTVRTIGEPIDTKRRPPSGYAAKFSAPYVFTAALLGGHGLGLGHEDFTDALVADPGRLAVMDRATVVADRECAERYPDSLPAVVTVRLRDGSTLVERVTDNRGGPARPLSSDELQRKFTDNATRAVDADTARALGGVVQEVHRSTDVRGTLAAVREAAA